MKLSRGQIRGSALIIAGLVFVLPSIATPSFGYSAADVNLSSAKDYSLVSGGALVVGATPSFSGTATFSGALSGSIASGTDLGVLAAGGMTVFENNTSAASTALADVVTARNLMNSFTGTTLAAGEIGGQTFTPGVYDTPSLAALNIGSSITLNGGGDYNSIFVFRTAAEMNVVGSVIINCIDGAQPSNIYWLAGAALDIGASAIVRGNFIATAALTTAASSTVYGSVLGLGAVNIGASSFIIHNLIQSNPSPTPTPSSIFTSAPVPTPTPKPTVIPLLVDMWFTENESKDGGILSWTGSNLEMWRFEGDSATYPETYNYGAFTSGWLGDLSNMLTGIEYSMTMDFRSTTGASVSKTISYTIEPRPIPIPVIVTPPPFCDSIITNLQYIPGPSGSTSGQLTWQTSGSGQVQFFGDVFLYPEIFQYGLFTSQWSGSLVNILPGVRHIVTVIFLADCQKLSSSSTSVMNPISQLISPSPSVSEVMPTPTPSLTATPVPTPVPTIASEFLTLPEKEKTNTVSTLPATYIARLFEYQFFPYFHDENTGQDTIKIIMKNLIPGQAISISITEESE